MRLTHTTGQPHYILVWLISTSFDNFKKVVKTYYDSVFLCFWFDDIHQF